MGKPSVTVRRTVEFSETDAAGLVHFSNYFRYMESAERVFFQQSGVTIFGQQGSAESFGFPRVETSCRFTRPLHFGDELTITLTLEQVRSCSLHFSATFSRALADGGSEQVAEGSMVTVFTVLNSRTGELRSRPLPEDWLVGMGWNPEPRAPRERA